MLTTTAVKELMVTIKFKHHSLTDAVSVLWRPLASQANFSSPSRLGFFRASALVHPDPSLFASVGEYLSTQKGWFAPYLQASARRPFIPRTISPDVIYSHGCALSLFSIRDTIDLIAFLSPLKPFPPWRLCPRHSARRRVRQPPLSRAVSDATPHAYAYTTYCYKKFFNSRPASKPSTNSHRPRSASDGNVEHQPSTRRERN